MLYFDELKKAMSLVANQSKTKFVGQTAVSKGTAMHNTLVHISEDKRLEFPVIESSHLGFSIGLSLQGYNVLSLFPRWNFLLVATSVLVNELDKLSEISCGDFNPKVIVRTSIGSIKPLNPQKQHVGDFTEAFQKMLTTVKVIRLDKTEDIVPEYQAAIDRKESTILVEWADKYNN